jgi:hypothetical protein
MSNAGGRKKNILADVLASKESSDEHELNEPR